ncbi:helix-turn-helix transcriptional regulator [Nocardia sp. NPDC051030]|uniref:helix-turn-helix domain-containing protein n=1 Tax=Nocardia sp. NPDC051030 TaxID=3155162 RepID=UPI00341493A5
MSEAFRDWKKAITRGHSTKEVARRLGMSDVTLARHLDRDDDLPEPRTVIALCRAYGVNPISGLIAAGYLTDEDADQGSAEGSLRHVTLSQIAEELVRRDPERKQDDEGTGRKRSRREGLGKGFLTS